MSPTLNPPPLLRSPIPPQGAGAKEPAKLKPEASSSSTAAAEATGGAAPPPSFYVLLTPDIMSELLEAFIEFFAGVAVPPPAPVSDAAAVGAPGAADGGSAAAAVAARAAAVEAVEAGAALPAPSPNLVFAALQVSWSASLRRGGGGG